MGRDAPPGHYYSVIVARVDDRRDLVGLCNGTLAYNEALSQSGWAAPQAHLDPLDLRPSQLLESGAHRASAQAVVQGHADFAALDAVSWALMRRHDRFAPHLREVAHTAPTPGLPLITAKGGDARGLHAAVAQGVAQLSSQDRDTLHLRGLVWIPADSYRSQPIPKPPGE